MTNFHYWTLSHSIQKKYHFRTIRNGDRIQPSTHNQCGCCDSIEMYRMLLQQAPVVHPDLSQMRSVKHSDKHQYCHSLECRDCCSPNTTMSHWSQLRRQHVFRARFAEYLNWKHSQQAEWAVGNGWNQLTHCPKLDHHSSPNSTLFHPQLRHRLG